MKFKKISYKPQIVHSGNDFLLPQIQSPQIALIIILGVEEKGECYF